MAEYLWDGGESERVFRISGALTVREAGELKAALAKAFEEEERIEVDLSSVTGADLSALQLFCSAHRTSKRTNKLFGLKDGISASFKRDVRRAGFSRKRGCILDTDDQCIWKEDQFRE